jgi:hypothetical protein
MVVARVIYLEIKVSIVKRIEKYIYIIDRGSRHLELHSSSLLCDGGCRHLSVVVGRMNAPFWCSRSWSCHGCGGWMVR